MRAPPTGSYAGWFYQRQAAGLPLPLTVLKESRCRSAGIDRGVLIASPAMLELLAEQYGAEALKRRWLSIDSRQQYGYGHNRIADLHMLGSPSLVAEYLAGPFADIPYTTLGDGGDFVNPDIFRPVHSRSTATYDLVLVASWAPFKSHHKLLEAARVLTDSKRPIRVLVVGSYCVPAHVPTLEEAKAYEAHIKAAASAMELDFTFVDNEDTCHFNADRSSVPGRYTKEEINDFLNTGKAGILLSTMEGTTRFVSECLCTDRPVVILDSLKAGTRKYINEKTGVIAEDSPQGIAKAVRATLEDLGRFSPRASFLEDFGFHNSNRNLEAKVHEIVTRQADPLFSPSPFLFGGDLWSLDYYDRFLPSMNAGTSQAFATPVASRRDLPEILNRAGLVGAGAEIGVWKGAFSRHILENWRGRLLYSIDPWKEWPPEEYPDAANVSQGLQDAFFSEAVRALAPFGARSRILRTTSREAAAMIADSSLDFVYLDAQHQRNAVEEDLLLWCEKLVPQGILCGHDYLDGMFSGTCYGVKSAVDDFARVRGKRVIVSSEDAWPSWFIIL